MFSFSEIKNTYKKISKYIHKTPVLTSSGINEMFDCEIFFKCENFQKAGAFKYRGAVNAILSQKPEDLKSGVITHSSGNHAQALSLATKMINVPAYIVMPETSARVKIEAVKSYGGKITFCKPDLKAREDMTKKIQEETGAILIHSYDNTDIIKGQATSVYEVLPEIKNIDIVMTPVGGGGLLSGTALTTKGYDKNIKVFGAEPKNADDAYRSFHSGVFVPSVNPNTIADGLLTSLGKNNFEIIKSYVDNILLCKEESILSAMRLIFERMKIVIEPSSAVPLACIIDNPEHFKNKRICIIVSGGNVDLNMFKNYFDTNKC